MCPALVDCLQDALKRGEKHGILGGTSTRRRRPLREVWMVRRHDYSPTCKSKRCAWCRAVNALVAELDAMVRERDDTGRFASTVRVVLNGPKARCGYRATYARGCRCPACSFAVSSLGHRLTGIGWDTGLWWREFMRADAGDRAGLLAEARSEAAAMLAVSGRLPSLIDAERRAVERREAADQRLALLQALAA